MDGFIIFDKPKGISSFKAIEKLKHKLNLNKVGHNGTLDPNATGLMVVASGKATKLLKLINEHDKRYIATISFGYLTKSYDLNSDILKDYFMDVNLPDIKKNIEILKNKTKQIPPMTSAIKINGKKLYEYQNEGIDIKPKERDIKIYDIKILSDLRLINNHYEIDIELYVSKGFYVRSFARDLGNLLNGDAILKDLRRIDIDNINIKDSKTLEEITINDIIPIEKYFDFPKVEVSNYIAKLVKSGITLDDRQTNLKGCFYVVNNCDIIAIYEEVDDNKYKPIIIF